MIKLRNLFRSLTLFATFFSFGQETNVAEKLGFSKDDKLLIIHADDLGMAHSENKASIKALEGGIVNSASIMVPCPWFPEIVALSKEQNMDLGLHLTLTSEWENYKWGPVSSKQQVAGLINKEGYFYESVEQVIVNAKASEIEVELRSQIQKAMAAGIDITHLDSHMGTLFATPNFIKSYITVAHEFNLPFLITTQSGEIPNGFEEAFEMLTPTDVMVNRVFIATPEDFSEGMDLYYTNVLNNLEPGLNVLLIHLAFDDEEMQAITIDHKEWGAEWRQEDYDFFTSDKCRTLLKDNNIKLVTWKEIRDKITRS